MAFKERTRMQERQKMVEQVLDQGLSISAAAKTAGVSRQTASLWVARARESGVAQLSEVSRRPHTLRPGVGAEIEQQVLQMAAKHRAWGAKKLHGALWPPDEPGRAPICARSVGRILQRAGHSVRAPGPSQAPTCPGFERQHCNALWQLDFKGLELGHAFRPLSILDDATRFCLALFPVARLAARSPQETPALVLWQGLWQVFGDYGLPDAILCDNGDGFNGSAGVGLTPFEMRLARLGIQVIHGRPYHPQTQGKVERFHRTLEAEWPDLLRVPLAQAARALEEVRQNYNWVRPHEALGQRKPGSLYSASLRVRPEALPAAQLSCEGEPRRVDGCGFISFHGNSYRVGRGLCGELVEVRAEADDSGHTHNTVFYSGQRLASLENIGAKGTHRTPTAPPQGVKDVLS